MPFAGIRPRRLGGRFDRSLARWHRPGAEWFGIARSKARFLQRSKNMFRLSADSEPHKDWRVTLERRNLCRGVMAAHGETPCSCTPRSPHGGYFDIARGRLLMMGEDGEFASVAL